MSKGLLLLSFVNLVCSQRAVDWFAINCPASTGDVSCTFRNTYNVDLAISLFFQTEDNDGSYFEVSSLLKSDQAKLANECPVNMTYSVDKSGEMYCLLTNITFPHSGVAAYCQYLSDGYEGFTYPDSANPNYKCPDTMRFGSNSEGTDFCTYNVPSSYTLPKGAISYCSPEAFSNHELGFKWGGFTTPTPSHPYRNESIVYCSRSWSKSQTGSAGDCYFILEKGESYNVIGKGTTNIIGAHAVKLNDKSHFDANSNPMNINCPSSIAKDCQYANQNNSNKDVYITTSFHSSSGKMDSLSCSYLTNKGLKVNVCSFSSYSADSSSSSCNFILPSNKVLSCSVTNDLIVDSATMRIMDQSYLGLSEPILNNDILCPNGTFPSTTMCDCYYDNKDKANDMLVIMQAVNANNQFNSFHCYIWGINVCGWGSNSNNMDDSGGCWFILPAGAAYNCSMEWGETTFTYSVMMKLNGSIYTIARNDNPNTQMLETKGNKIPQSRSSDEMYILFRKWKRKFDKIYTSENEETVRFGNFKQFVTLADNTKFGTKPTPFSSLNSLSDLSMTEFVDMYRGCAYPLGRE